MKLLKRFGWYLGGVVLGTILVLFIFGDREIACTYFPNDRVLGDLQKKELRFSESVKCINECIGADADTSFYFNVLHASKVDFSYNERGTDSDCNDYKLIYSEDGLAYTLYVKNCKDSTATFHKIDLPNSIECDCPTAE
ncbi:MAG: hypothetical protein HWE14_01820 [Flavobacteriia bacterium]|nr:hypothetical protein [Flavobacteriia bacterium]